MTGCRAVCCAYGEQRHSRQVKPSAARAVVTSCTRRDFPIPASPLRSTTCPRPCCTCAARSRSTASSTSRPTNGVRCGGGVTSRRPCAPLVPRTWYSALGAVVPGRWCSPRDAQTKYPCTRCCVAALITIVSAPPGPGFCAARLGVAPTANWPYGVPPRLCPHDHQPRMYPDPYGEAYAKVLDQRAAEVADRRHQR